MKELQELIESLRSKAAECRRRGDGAKQFPDMYWLWGKADGLKTAANELETLLKELLNIDLKNLETEKIETDGAGCIVPAEILRIRIKYGVHLSGDYDFARTGELRLTDGSKLVF